MDHLLLVKPTLAHQKEILVYKEAFVKHKEHLYGGNRLTEIEKLENWLQHLQQEASAQTCRPNRAPSSTFLCIRENDQKMVGICNIRHHINHPFLVNIAGHIGYSIHPDYRQKGYAKEQLRLALLEAKKLGLKQVLITAADWNIASQKTILANGGVYEDSRIDENDGEVLRRYWIDIAKTF